MGFHTVRIFGGNSGRAVSKSPGVPGGESVSCMGGRRCLPKSYRSQEACRKGHWKGIVVKANVGSADHCSYHIIAKM